MKPAPPLPSDCLLGNFPYKMYLTLTGLAPSIACTLKSYRHHSPLQNLKSYVLCYQCDKNYFAGKRLKSTEDGYNSAKSLGVVFVVK